MLTRDSIAWLNLFRGLNKQELEEVLACGDEEGFLSGKLLLEESAISVDLFVILDGKVSVEMAATKPDTDDPMRTRLATLTEGDVFGEVGFVEEKRRSATVIATTDGRVLRLNGDRLHGLFERSAHTGYTLMRNIATLLAHRLVDCNVRLRHAL